MKYTKKKMKAFYKTLRKKLRNLRKLFELVFFLENNINMYVFPSQIKV